MSDKALILLLFSSIIVIKFVTIISLIAIISRKDKQISGMHAGNIEALRAIENKVDEANRRFVSVSEQLTLCAEKLMQISKGEDQIEKKLDDNLAEMKKDHHQ